MMLLRCFYFFFSCLYLCLYLKASTNFLYSIYTRCLSSCFPISSVETMVSTTSSFHSSKLYVFIYFESLLFQEVCVCFLLLFSAILNTFLFKCVMSFTLQKVEPSKINKTVSISACNICIPCHYLLHLRTEPPSAQKDLLKWPTVLQLIDKFQVLRLKHLWCLSRNLIQPR